MTTMTRRSVLRAGGALAAGTALAVSDPTGWARCWAAQQPFAPEKGATLRLLRWRGFVQTEPEEEAFARMVSAFMAATGVPVAVAMAPLEQMPLKVLTMATIGAGADLAWSLNDDAHLIPDKLVDVSDVATYLGAKLGGWYPVAKEYGMRGDRWICLPVAIKGYALNFRIASVKAAGFGAFPTTLDDFMRLAKQLKRNGHPMGFALGNAPSDANNWCYSLLWAFGGGVADADDHVIINRPETLAALDYARELFPQLIEGTLSWTDKSNNEAFLSGAISCTNNPIVLYAQMRAQNNPLADDIDHAYFPVGRSGEPREFQVMYPMMLFKHSPYPNAAKALMAFFMERAQYDPWLHDSAGYLSHTLKAYNDNPVWTEDPKRTVFRDAAARSKSFGYPGQLNYAASSVLSDLVVVHMFADAASGRLTPKQAAEAAERRIAQYYQG
jgi:multiple sugar transport system substrate-binding protein